EARNVVGLMPHPERAIESVLGSSDGAVMLQSIVASAVSGPTATSAASRG
ncbi:MAG: hypothetical protein JHC94_08525, partial [Acidimicrobiia bacterium]|nr:hypothetical protein [Acidimicrobiia bacterium]